MAIPSLQEPLFLQWTYSYRWGHTLGIRSQLRTIVEHRWLLVRFLRYLVVAACEPGCNDPHGVFDAAHYINDVDNGQS